MSKTKKNTTKKSAKKAAKTKKPTLAQRIASEKKKNELAKRKMSKSGEKLFKEAVKDIFKKFKDLESISWTQYTPHWNDGDECVFSCHVSDLAINDEEVNECEGLWNLEEMCKLLANKEVEKNRIVMELADKSNKKEWEIEQLKRELETIESRDLEDVKRKYDIKKYTIELLGEIDESVYQEMFGEGLVVVNRDGASVEDYEHD